ncbi:hypothetical protein [Pseudomonas duriflava]|nr:hypothetical protein [Pseudomonas duriflava]
MTAFPLKQNAFVFPQIEVDIQPPERSLGQQIKCVVQGVIARVEQGWPPVVA